MSVSSTPAPTERSRPTAPRIALAIAALLTAPACRTTDADLDPEVVAEQQLSRAAKTVSRDASSALKTYERVLADLDEEADPRLRTRALLGRACCRVHLGEVSKGRIDARIARLSADRSFSDDDAGRREFEAEYDQVIALADRVDEEQRRAATVPARSPRIELPPRLAPVRTHGATAPRIEPRSRWNAAAMRSNHDPMSRVQRITVHHTGSDFQAVDAEGTARAIRSIQRDHQSSRGWADIGYHFLVDRSGRVWEGRPMSAQGAHAGNRALNRGNIGVAVLGNFDTQSMSAAQRRSLHDLLDHLRSRHAIPRTAVLTHHEILSRNHAGGTACPGRSLAAVVVDYREGHHAGHGHAH